MALEDVEPMSDDSPTPDSLPPQIKSLAKILLKDYFLAALEPLDAVTTDRSSANEIECVEDALWGRTVVGRDSVAEFGRLRRVGLERGLTPISLAIAVFVSSELVT